MYGNFQKLLVLGAGLGTFTDIFDTNIIGTASVTAVPDLHLSLVQYGTVGAMTFIGGPIGAILFGPLADRYGRKRTFSVTLMLFVVGELLAALAQNFEQLLSFRFIVGFAIGADFACAYILASEFSTKKLRGRLLSNLWILAASATIVQGVIGYLLLPLGPLQWRVLFLIGVIPPVVALLVRTRIPESPRWYVSKGDLKQARKSMEQIGLDPSDVSLFQTDVSLQAKTSYQSLRPYILTVTIPLVLVGMFAIAPLNLIAQLGPLLYGLLNVSKSNSLLYQVLVFGVPSLIGVVISSMLIDRVGRYRLVWVSVFLTGVVLVLLAYVVPIAATSILPLLVLLFATSLLSFVFINVLYMLGAELYPVAVRGAGQGINVAGLRATGLIGTYVGSYLVTTIGLADSFYVNAVYMFACFIIIVLWIGRKVDTRGMELEEVSERFARTKN